MYEFNEDDAFAFARHVNAETKRRGNELGFKECPYCHGAGKGNTFRFSINLETGAFKCLRSSCGASGNMITLAKDFDFRLTNDFEEYERPKKKYREFKQPPKKIEPKIPAIEYLKSRGIGEEIAKRYEITVQTGKDNILVFPFYDENGKMVFIKYRKTDFDKTRDNNKEWCEKDGKPILFGMKQCNLENKTLIITEGQMDSLSVAEAGFENALSVPTGAKGFTWVPYCWDFVHKFDTIIVFGDLEKGKMSLLDEICLRFKLIIKRVRDEDYKDCKDANEILTKYGREQVKACINNAVLAPMKKVRSLAEVEDINPFDIEKLKTGFKDLDRLLYGGLPFGGIALVTGKPGEGKSTVASQILLSAVENKHKCFAYSGELPNHLFKSWITYQAAGGKHVIAYDTKWGETGYNVSKQNKALIEEWYKDSIYIFDSASIDGDEKTDLIRLTEDMINRYGVDVILIDNLMTALDLTVTTGSDKYEKQSMFVKALARMALKYNVLIILVAHMRKNNFSTNGNDEVAGSSDISNLASVSLMYERDSELMESQRRLKCWKNRLFGKTFGTGWIMEYDERSKRVYGESDDVNRQYSWDKSEKGDSENPFY